ncbi:MAG: hypothetical protein GY866_21760, partial [Proteobacteria bacterium]|nr:hypothetical protein [Pseudomonadota bacterium]
MKRTVQGDTYAVSYPIPYEKDVMTQHVKAKIDESKVGHPIMPKYAKLIENVKKELEKKGKQLIFTEEKTQHNKVRRIVQHNVPVEMKEIAIINADTAKGDNLQKISDEYNAGNVKLVIANKKAEVGVNLQKGTSAIHHLTFPWTPASIQQRNGRGLRQGNKAAHLNIYYYMGKNSIDNYRIDLLKKKKSWINDILTGDASEAMNADANNMEEMDIMISDNPEEARAKIEKQKAETIAREQAKVRRVMINNLRQMGHLTNDLDAWDDIGNRKKGGIESKIAKLNEEIRNTESRIANYKEQGEKDKIKGPKIKLDKLKTKKAGLDHDLETFDAKHEQVRQEKETRLNTLKGTLKKKSGQLPFDISAIDNPNNTIVTKDSKTFTKGKMYECDYDGRKSIIEIKDVDISFNLFKHETITGDSYLSLNSVNDRYGWYNIEGLSSKYNPVEVSYSKEELELKKILMGSARYSDIHEKLSREIFATNVSDINFGSSGAFYRERSGEINYIQDVDKLDPASRAGIVYPEPSNENYRSDLLKFYLARKKDSDFDNMY